MGINYDKIEETVKGIMQMERKLGNGEKQCEDIPIVSMPAEEVLNKINSGGLDALRKVAEEEEKEQKEMEKNNTDG